MRTARVWLSCSGAGGGENKSPIPCHYLALSTPWHHVVCTKRPSSVTWIPTRGATHLLFSVPLRPPCPASFESPGFDSRPRQCISVNTYRIGTYAAWRAAEITPGVYRVWKAACSIQRRTRNAQLRQTQAGWNIPPRDRRRAGAATAPGKCHIFVIL